MKGLFLTVVRKTVNANTGLKGNLLYTSVFYTAVLSSLCLIKLKYGGQNQKQKTSVKMSKIHGNPGLA